MYNKFIKLCEVPRSFRKVSASMALTRLEVLNSKYFDGKLQGMLELSICYSCHGCALKEPFQS